MGSLEFSVIGIQKELSESFGRSIGEVGLLVTAFAIGVVIGTPVVLMLTAKVNRFKIMFFGMAGLVVLTVLSTIISSYEVMMLNRFVSAVLSGITVSCSYAMCAEIPPPEQRPQAMSFVYAGHSVASVLIIPIVETITHITASWQASYVLIICLQATSLVLIYFFVPRNAALWNGTKEDQFKLFKDKRMILAILAPVLSVGGVYMVYSYIEPIFGDGFGIPQKYMYIFLFVFGAMTIVGNVISSYVESHGGLGSMKYVFVAQACVLVLVSFAMLYTENEMWWLGCGIMMLVGVIMYIINTPIQSYYIRVAKADYPGAVNLSACFQSIAFNLGVTVGSIIGGGVFEHDAIQYVGFIGAVFTVCAILVLLALERTPGKELLAPRLRD